MSLSPEEMTLLDLLIGLDDAGSGVINTDGETIYFYSRDSIPEEYQEVFEHFRPLLQERLTRITKCYCRLCNGRPVLGYAV
jgi:hypothetical protein